MTKPNNPVELGTPRTLKYRWILLTLAAEIIGFTAMNIYVSGTAGLLLVPLFAVASGWQMGTLTERNDWVNGYHSIPNSSNKESEQHGK